MATALDIATDAAVLIGELAQGQSLSNEDAQFILTRLNALLDSMSQEEAWIYNRTIQPYALTANVASYAVGPTAAAPFNTARPTKIDAAKLKFSLNGGTLQVKDLDIIDYARYVAYSDRAASAQLAESLYYDNAAPNGNLFLFPVPNCLTPTILELTFWTQLQQFASLTTVLAMPQGYYEAIVLALAVAISPAYNKPVDQVTAARAAQTSERIKTINKMILMPGLPPQAYLPQQQAPGQQGPSQQQQLAPFQ